VNDSLTVSGVPVGGLATARVLIKTPPQSVADWSFRADVGYDPDITICSVRIAQYGYAIPCLNESTPMRAIGRGTGLHGYQTGWLDLYKLSNVGQSVTYRTYRYSNAGVVAKRQGVASPILGCRKIVGKKIHTCWKIFVQKCNIWG